MPSLNRVELIGHLGKDPEIRYTQSGKAVCSITMATSEKYKDKSSGETVESTEWHRCILWGKQGELAAEWLSKGDIARMEGKLQTRKWQDKDGNDRYTTEVNVRDFMPLKTKGGSSGAPQAAKSEPAFEDDIPF